MNIERLFDPATFTLTYVVFDPKTRDAIVIDPVLDYDVLSSQTSTASIGRVETLLKEKGLTLHYVLETHAHADHLSGSAEALYTSVHERLYALPDATRVFVGHDYQPNGRALRWETAIGASKESNIQLRASTSRADFVTRDGTPAVERT